MASRLRPGSQKKQIKEKIVQIYESFFKGEDVAAGNANFWDELFLLRPRVSVLESELTRLSSEQLSALKVPLNQLFARCVDVVREEHLLRAAHALQTLSGLVAGVCRQPRPGPQTDAVDLLVGLDAAEREMGRLCGRCAELLAGLYPETLRSLVLDALLAVAAASEDINRNGLLEYLMINSSLFEPVIQLLSHGATRSVHGHKCVLLLTLLVNYRKSEPANPYVVKLSILDDELALNGYSQVITAALSEFNWKYAAQTCDSQSQGWLSSLTSMVGNMFVADELATRSESIKANHGVLVALYEAVHLNRNFIATLTQASTDASSQPPSPQSTLDREQAPAPPAAGQPDPLGAPVNLLVAFLQYCSIVMQDTKSDAATNNVRQCFIVLTCVSEDQYCNSLMHDPNLVFVVRLHRLPMRHRKATDRPAHPQPLATALLDLTVEFIMSHLMKRFPLDLYLQCVGIVHRVLCYQKRCRVRLGYHWRELWSALMSLLKFIVSNENAVVKRNNIFELAILVVNIFNLFITYGDTFLPTPTSYDELYYELIRMHQVFSNLYSMSLRYSNEGEHREAAMRLTNNLVNIRAICNHFSPKIEAWSQANNQTSLTEDQVLDVVRSNYESLTLKLQESLDQYERYAESPRYSSFFTAVVRSVIRDTWSGLNFDQVDHASLLNQTSAIS
ncbi:armadillo-like helical domain-containing protein 3 [Amphibalanus amphitrite]|uniref:armadillo-like helical domain-containing protein 3 n=1 Tax=Amphibalanus amphitrite TaxID=1232801 RepID=UPI001C925FC5|nr:armadillo-like helical domain-containing protein 3 [Amphibalanus amphitrite]XP_043208628.1 armadillo-like helical domain-containing protein 3 [Amphibalanus amphitrite]XP_043208629.1 armadillo-like helical domain-containing protein 3 [Amphibalanus amphitrite]XP_043208630.1 armadillo-like helical domain-containing protein 3 [Amphibalanus amphitrite]